ncbi:lipopolysaccharide biosynthesis protein [Sphingomonas aracearum]|uniref:Lipopolysaccharide biosynthesis protein n=1 Tax=Sphingomonas aracearum TaxID=2283317 RepID=A0A369VST6_9SPHN|nr:lipopolysaccharide biosynthesis protein [Sphingomonas aracearum]RDE04735.1 lipopolysaccharide biosynthesis protein [Sphingomonas aracearum]
MRLVARLPFLFIAGRVYGPDAVGRFALAVVVVELAALIATVGLKRGLAQALTSSDQPHACVVWDALALTFVVSLLLGALLFAFPQVMYPNSIVDGLDRWLAAITFAPAMSDVSLAALAYRRNVKATVTARAVIEPWTISIAAWAFSFVTLKDGLVLSYIASVVAALTASLVPFVRSYGWPHGWTPHPGRMFTMARRNAPLAGADSIEWATRNVDRFILGLTFEPKIVGIYYMAQQVASIPQKLKTSFDPILGPVITEALKRNDRAAIAHQVRQVAFWIVAAQLGLALIGSIPGEGVMGVVGPQFVAGTAALGFLLTGEAVASTGAVCESALVYIARIRNLVISVTMLLLQIGLSFGLIYGMRALGWPENWQAAGVAVALLLALLCMSLAKASLLTRLLGARVSPLRWPLLWAVAGGAAVGGLFTALPRTYEWAELLFGIPAMIGTYAWLLYRFAFTDEDRALFSRMPKEPSLPTAAAV